MNKIIPLRRIFVPNIGSAIVRGCKTEAVTTDKEEGQDLPANFFEDGDEEEVLRREQIEKSRQKSRLLPQHLRSLYNIKPYDESQSWIHNTVKYKRMQFGRYGLASGIDPRICFPTKEEKANRIEYERVAFPETILEMKAKIVAQRKAEKEAILNREEQITKKLEKLDQWRKELNDRVEKREKEARAAKEKKERLVEEVRRHFGFKIDPRDDRFKELLAQKEKEDKKKTKEAKKVAREAKIMAKLLDQEKLKDEPPKQPEKPQEN